MFLRVYSDEQALEKTLIRNFDIDSNYFSPVYFYSKFVFILSRCAYSWNYFVAEKNINYWENLHFDSEIVKKFNYVLKKVRSSRS